MLSCLLALFFLPCFSLCSLIFPSPQALCRYLLPCLRVVSSVHQLSVSLQHVCCSSCSLSDLLASHYPELLLYCFCCLFFVFFFVLFGVMPVSSSSSSCCFTRAAVICSSSARMLFFLLPSDLASHSSELLSGLLSFEFYFSFFFLVWLVLLCSRTRYASISLALP